MNETHPEPLTVWRFIRRYFVQIVIGAVLVVAVYGALLVWVPYQREQRILKEIEAYWWKVEFQYCGPKWIPQTMRDRTTLFSRVTQIYFDDTVTDAGLEHLKGLTNLRILELANTHVTDAGLKHLKGLTNLTELDLRNIELRDANGQLLDVPNTQVTDAGLEHLKGLSNLVSLDLVGTRTTAEGRAMLRKALPNCSIDSISESDNAQ